MKTSDRVILPLVGSAFQPGKAAEAIERIEDKELARIAQGEYYFFSAQAEKCVETVKDYLDHDDVMLRLSADMLYTFANVCLVLFVGECRGWLTNSMKSIRIYILLVDGFYYFIDICFARSLIMA